MRMNVLPNVHPTSLNTHTNTIFIKISWHSRLRITLSHMHAHTHMQFFIEISWHSQLHQVHIWSKLSQQMVTPSHPITYTKNNVRSFPFKHTMLYIYNDNKFTLSCLGIRTVIIPSPRLNEKPLYCILSPCQITVPSMLLLYFCIMCVNVWRWRAESYCIVVLLIFSPSSQLNQSILVP